MLMSYSYTPKPVMPIHTYNNAFLFFIPELLPIFVQNTCMKNSDQNAKWNQLYKVADDFFALQPWKLVDEVDIFGVRSPDTGKEY
ncbi:MAG: hypothetical protein R6U52_09525, partial [Kosmotogaceae bacterium]